METRMPVPSESRGLLAGSATIGTMLLVSGSAKIGYGVWGLGIAALTCILYGVGKYVVACAGMLLLRCPSAGPFRRLRERRDGRGITAARPAASVVPEPDPSRTSRRLPV